MIATPADALIYISLVPDLSLLTKATVILGMGLIATRLSARRRASVRHLLLAATFASVLLLPIAALTAPEIAVPLTTVATHRDASFVTTPVASSALPAAGRVSSAPGWIFPSNRIVGRAAWVLSSLLFLAPLAGVLWRLGRLRRTGLPWPEMRDAVQSLAADAGVRRTVDVVLHEEVPSPLTFGTRHPVVVLPPDARTWDDADLRRALVHELEHVRRGDWAMQTVARAICGAWWFHPLVWIAWRQLSLEAERACDDAVVEKEEGMEYAEQLVALAKRMSAADAQPTLGMANRSDLSARVSSLLDAHQRRGRAGAVAMAAAIGSAALMVLAIAPVRAVAHVPSDGPVAAPTEGREQDRRQRGLDRELYEAAGAGDLTGINELLTAGANVNAAIDGDGSPLIAAARAGRQDIVSLLLDKGADPNMGVEGDGSPLIAAAAHGETNVVSLLLDRGAGVDLIVAGDENPLIQASGKGHLAVVQLLVARGADVNTRVHVVDARGADEWRTPLRMARQGRHAAVVAFLISAGASD